MSGDLAVTSRRGLGHAARALLAVAAAAYVVLLVGVPVLNVYAQALSHGLAAFAEAVTAPETLHAAKLTLLIAAIVVPANAGFGLAAAWVLARRRSPLRVVVGAALDLPLAVSASIAGLFTVLVYSPTVGLLAPTVGAAHVKVIFAFPGLVLATLLVTLPYVSREVLPALAEVDRAEDEAARMLGATAWQTFWRVTFPAIRWSIVYGVALCAARAVGEFGAVSVVSGKLIGETNTLTLHVERAYMEYDNTQAFAGASLLTTIGLVPLALDRLLRLAGRIRR